MLAFASSRHELHMRDVPGDVAGVVLRICTRHSRMAVAATAAVACGLSRCGCHSCTC